MNDITFLAGGRHKAGHYTNKKIQKIALHINIFHNFANTQNRMQMKYTHQIGSPRKKMRWEDFDYSSQGVYFITVVTHHKVCLFGHIENGEMILNDAGKMILEQYYKIESPTTQCLDVVVMPNHIHFTIYIPKDRVKKLPDIMKRYKSITTTLYCNGVNDYGWKHFEQHLWQRSYWDSIVWNGGQYEFIQRYIFLNPQRWDRDAINENHGKEIDDINGCIKRLKQI